MISLTEPEVEQPCAICLESSRRWCRGEIMKLLDDGFVEVHAVDYGETRRLPLTEVRLLEQEFLASAGPGSTSSHHLRRELARFVVLLNLVDDCLCLF